MTRTDPRRPAKRRFAGLLLASLSLSMAACSGAATGAEHNEAAATAQPVEVARPAANASADVAQDLRPTGAPAPAPKSSDEFTESKVLGKTEKKMVDGSTACYIDFAYAGQERQSMPWEESCAKTDAGMIDRAKLEELGWWEKLDEYARKFVEAMPGGKVLYVSGEFSASIFPIDETGSPYEVEVAD